MPPPIEEFWRLIHKSRLLSTDELRPLRRAFAAKHGDRDTNLLARWLVSHGKLTHYQATVLLAGKPWPFLYGDYVVEDRIKQGPMAGAFRARHGATNYRVLLRFLRRAEMQDAGRLEATRKRVSRCASLRHPHLLRCYELVESSRYNVVVCEEPTGACLADRLASEGAFAPAEACRIARQIALAVAELHASGVAHGGIAPLNVWLNGESRNARLMTFPLAPEAKPARPADDLLGLGRTLVCLLTGDVREWSLAEASQALRQSQVPNAIIKLLDFLLADDPDARYRDAQMAAEALAAYVDPKELQSFPEPATPPQLAYEAWLEGKRSAAEASVATAADRATDGPIVSIDTDAVGERDAAIPSLEADRDDDPAMRLLRTRRRKNNRLVTAGAATVVVLMVLASAVALWQNADGISATQTDAGAGRASAAATRTEDANQRGDASEVVSSVARQPAGRTLWQSPTAGPPLDVRWLPGGAQFILAVRPHDFLSHPEGAKVLDTLGPLAQQMRDDLQELVGAPLEEFEQIVVALYDGETGSLEMAVVARGAEPLDRQELLRHWGDPREETVQGTTVYRAAEHVYYLPVDTDERVFAAVPRDRADEVVGVDEPPLLILELEQLIALSDAQRHVTLLVTPPFLATRAEGYFGADFEALREGVVDFLGQSTKAALLSFHLDDNFFTELRVVGANTIRPPELHRQVAERLSGLPGRVRRHVESLYLTPYSQAVLLRFPSMVDLWSEYTRHAEQDRHIVLRSYLPAVAAHNLALGTQLALVEDPGEAAPASTSDFRRPAEAATTAEQRLGRTISLSFPRETLEKSMELLSDEIGLEIEILGSDLQLEGITRNQSFGLDERDQPAEVILRKILQLANPDGKLVYFVKSRDDGTEVLYVTTRAAAAKRGDRLPAVFSDGE